MDVLDEFDIINIKELKRCAWPTRQLLQISKYDGAPAHQSFKGNYYGNKAYHKRKENRL
jgi:hypothetical protein